VDKNTVVHRLTQIYTEKQESKSAEICENLWIKTPVGIPPLCYFPEAV
jgi:hypothetical protein